MPNKNYTIIDEQHSHLDPMQHPKDKVLHPSANIKAESIFYRIEHYQDNIFDFRIKTFVEYHPDFLLDGYLMFTESYFAIQVPNDEIYRNHLCKEFISIACDVYLKTLNKCYNTFPDRLFKINKSFILEKRSVEMSKEIENIVIIMIKSNLANPYLE